MISLLECRFVISLLECCLFVNPSGPSEVCDSFQHAQRGVIPRSFEQLFALIKEEQLRVSVCTDE